MLTEINNQHGKVVAQKISNDECLTIKEQQTEFGLFRWYHRGDNAIQSLFNVNKPTQLLMPVYQSMLLFLLWRHTPLRIANLGMGAGGIERALAEIKGIELCSVEQNADVIDIARQHFSLAKSHNVHLESAETFLNYKNKTNNKHRENIVSKPLEGKTWSSAEKFDFILMDIFVEMTGQHYLTDIDFYLSIKDKLIANNTVHGNMTGDKLNVQPAGGAFFNISVGNAKQLIEIISCLQQVFLHCALIDFTDYKNIVLYMSDEKIQSPKQLNVLNTAQLRASKLNTSQSKSAQFKEQVPALASRLTSPIDYRDVIQHLRIIT